MGVGVGLAGTEYEVGVAVGHGVGLTVGEGIGVAVGERLIVGGASVGVWFCKAAGAMTIS